MIPKSFQLVNRTYRVEKMGDDVAEAGERHGDCNRAKALIRINFDSPENSEHTFYHELAHALLYATTKPKLSDNESFVDSLGAAIHQYMLTRKGELK